MTCFGCCSILIVKHVRKFCQSDEDKALLYIEDDDPTIGLDQNGSISSSDTRQPFPRKRRLPRRFSGRKGYTTRKIANKERIRQIVANGEVGLRYAEAEACARNDRIDQAT